MSLKLGVIGTGAIGRDHIVAAVGALLNSQVVAVTDINLEQAAKVVADLNISAEVYLGGHALIHSPEVEAVLVTSWGPSHEEFVLAHRRSANRCSAKNPWRSPPSCPQDRRCRSSFRQTPGAGRLHAPLR